jgi:hypothetical protein
MSCNDCCRQKGSEKESDEPLAVAEEKTKRGNRAVEI